MTDLLAARAQMAMSLAFHIIFPISSRHGLRRSRISMLKGTTRKTT
ncbi:MAG: hypothetical protein OXD49_18435 [Candidatus Poribacteria bacterium]|nr:hypothetical protein [Candidatus Poribacteria bacterium]